MTVVKKCLEKSLLSAFLDFEKIIFIRCRLKQRISELSVMATEMVSITVFFEWRS